MCVSFRPWTTSEVRALKALAPYGTEGCAVLLGRTQASIRHTARRHQIAIVSGSTDQPLTDEARRILLQATDSVRLPLCSRCVTRPATVTEHDLCRVCWLEHVVDTYKADAIAAVYAREKARLRQLKHRGRVCSRCRQVYSARQTSTETRCRTCRA